MTDETTPSASAFEFTGTWREFAPIAFTNLLLTIVTLGIYRFWAKTRERRYLWSRTNFIGDPLEWTGTGKELLIGFVLVLLLLGSPVLFLQFGMQALILRGHVGTAILVAISAYLAILYLFGLARFRATRYRLSRSYWRGIRGGSEERGWTYGGEALWRTIVGGLALGLMVPWSMTTLWNRRWGRMSFGDLTFQADAQWQPIIGRYLLIYLLPIAGCVGTGIFVATSTLTAQSQSAIMFGAVVSYLLMGLIMACFYAKYLREAIGSLRLKDLDFSFTAGTDQWILLFLGHAALLICTLGLGFVFIGYRNWAFFIRHMEASGEISVDDLAQSTTPSPTQGEGLLDAFDVGAF